MSTVTLDDLDAIERDLKIAGVTGLNGAHGELDDERLAIASEPRDPNPWPEPWPFDAWRLPTFPSHVLPTWMREWTQAETVSVQVPHDLPACIALAAASLVVARTTHIEVKPGWWREPCNLWLVVAADPGERKSIVYKDAMAPVFAWVQIETAAKEHVIAERARDRRILEAKIKKAEAAAVDGKQIGGVDGRRLAEEYQRDLEQLPEMHPPTIVADDCTPEALAVLLSKHGERMGIFSTEAGPFELMAGRYSDKGSNFEIYLKAHAGDAHTVNRISRDPLNLREPLVTLGLTVQPEVIQGLSQRDGFRCRGLLARFLYAMPQTMVGERQSDPEPMPDVAARVYQAALASMLVHLRETRTLLLTHDACAARAAMQDSLESRMRPDGDLHPIRDWANKLVGATLRMAGVLHVSDYAMAPSDLPDDVPVTTWLRAEALARYFLEHAVAAFGAMGCDETTELAKRVMRWARRGQRRTLTAREAQRATHATGEAMGPALAILIERGLIRPAPAQESTGGRPPSPTYEVRGSVLSA